MGVIFLMVEVLLLLPTANSVNRVLSSTVQAIDKYIIYMYMLRYINSLTREITFTRINSFFPYIFIITLAVISI